MKKNDINIRKIVARNLKQFRSDLNMSQLDLSNVTGLSHNFINNIEHEKKWPSDETITKLAKALKKESYQFFMPETKLYINRTEVLIEELSDSIAFLVREKCENFIIDNGKNPT